MRRTAAAIAALLFTPTLLSAQVRPQPRADAVMSRPAGGDVMDECELSAGESLVMRFGSCSPLVAGGVSKEIEIVEYRNGDSRSRVHRVTVRGWDMVHKDVRVVRLAWGDFDGDGRTDLLTDAARIRPGKVKVGRVTLAREYHSGVGGASDWPPMDMDSDGYPVTVELQDDSGGSTTIAFDDCRMTASTESRANRDTVTLVCREVRMVAALDANPYARFVRQATSRAAVAGTLVDRRTPTRSDADARGRVGIPTTRLDGAQLESWSVAFDSATGGTAQWALGLRPRGGQ